APTFAQAVYATDSVAATLVADTTSPGQPYHNSAAERFFLKDTAAGGIDTSTGTFDTISSNALTLVTTVGSSGSIANGAAPVSANFLTLQAANAGQSVYVSDSGLAKLVDDLVAPGRPYTNTAANTFFLTASGSIDAIGGTYGTITGNQVTLVAT